jgi:stage II sporulation protein GA (sporulation sigma-E factor processing peptidase)
MTIYLDYIFIENLLIDYILLKETAYLSRKNVTNKRIVLAAVVASLYVVIMIFLKVQQLNFLISKVLIAIIVVYISFSPRKLNELIKYLGVFFLISVINVGSVYIITNWFNIQTKHEIFKLYTYILGLLLSKFFTLHMWKIYKREIKKDDLIYLVRICLGGKMYEYNAFLDTGNSVFSYTYNVPIIFAEILDESMINELEYKENFSVRTITLSDESNRKAYLFDKIEIIKNEKTWYIKGAIVFEKRKLSKDYNMLLNYILYVQSLGGIKI